MQQNLCKIFNVFSIQVGNQKTSLDDPPHAQLSGLDQGRLIQILTDPLHFLQHQLKDLFREVVAVVHVDVLAALLDVQVI